jgi:hypothetical protein
MTKTRYLSAVAIAFMFILAGVGCADAVESSAPEADSVSALNRKGSTSSDDPHVVLITNASGTPICTGALIGEGYLVATSTTCNPTKDKSKAYMGAATLGNDYNLLYGTPPTNATVKKIVDNDNVRVLYLSPKITVQQVGVLNNDYPLDDYADEDLTLVGWNKSESNAYVQKKRDANLWEDNIWAKSFRFVNENGGVDLFGGAGDLGGVAKVWVGNNWRFAGAFQQVNATDDAVFVRFDTKYSWINDEARKAKSAVYPSGGGGGTETCNEWDPGYPNCGDF